MTAMKTKCIAPWFGSNRMLAEHVGKELACCRWVGVPFAGGMSELAHITSPSMVVNDLHSHVINLAAVIRDKESLRALTQMLERTPFHPEELAICQDVASRYSHMQGRICVSAAYAYFVSQWMGRSGQAGTDSEFKGKLSVRWTSSGGDSNTRYRSATRSLAAWSKIMRRCNFTSIDAIEFLGQCKDQPEHGIYCDPPFVKEGEAYRHKVDVPFHSRLAEKLGTFTAARVVVRYYDHPLVRELYSAERWDWQELVGRKQSNAEAAEVLIVSKREAV